MLAILAGSGRNRFSLAARTSGVKQERWRMGKRRKEAGRRPYLRTEKLAAVQVWIKRREMFDAKG